MTAAHTPKIVQHNLCCFLFTSGHSQDTVCAELQQKDEAVLF